MCSGQQRQVFNPGASGDPLPARAADIARQRAHRLESLSAGAETKGPRRPAWCYLELADLEVEEINAQSGALGPSVC